MYVIVSLTTLYRISSQLFMTDVRFVSVSSWSVEPGLYRAKRPRFEPQPNYPERFISRPQSSFTVLFVACVVSLLAFQTG